MGLLDRRRSEAPDPWRLVTLSDFWFVARWIESQRAARALPAAMDRYLSRITPILCETVPLYASLLRELDAITGGIYSRADAGRNARLGLPPDFALLPNQDAVGKQLHPLLDKLSAGSPAQSVAHWKSVFSQFENYRVFVTRLVQQYGNFELIAMSMPGTGDVTAQPTTQRIMGQLYALSTRWIRLFDLAMSFHQAKRSATAVGFFETTADPVKLVQAMLHEYMVEADPARIAAATERATKQGRRPSRYRFWRPAETVRQLAKVTYETHQDRTRHPRINRPYVALDLSPAPVFPIDAQRFEWALKEVFNNAIAATSVVALVKQGFVAKPLPRHDSPEPEHAVRVTVEQATVRHRIFWKRSLVRVTIADEGVGIDAAYVNKVLLWAFSPRRAASEKHAADPQHAGQSDMREILIGGKGIGLPFAMTTIREHGGDLRLTSKTGQGTVVQIDLPMPSPLA